MLKYRHHAFALSFVWQAVTNIDYQKELNPEQLDVVLHGDGPCLVLAGAGSGKTRTVTYRVAYLLEQGIRPEEILLLTFTNKAAKEMLSRVAILTSPSSIATRGEGLGIGVSPHGEGLGMPVRSPAKAGVRADVGGETLREASGSSRGEGVTGGTFHSVASRVLRMFAPLVGRSKSFTILDEDDSKSLIKLCLKDAWADTSRDKCFPSPSSFQNMYSYSRNATSSLREVLERRSPALVMVSQILERVAELYEARKCEANALDFDDLLLKFLELLQNHPEVRKNLATRFKYVLVDEFQDTNLIQAKIVQLLSSVHGNLLVVGDDAQSIYSFRAAEIKNILDFPKTYPNAKVFRLTANYRSSPEILSLANHIIKNNQGQFDKNLQAIKKSSSKPKVFSSATTLEEASHIVDEIIHLKVAGVPTKEIAVLFRAAFHAQPLEYELMKRNLAYEFRGGMRFFERAHIKDVSSHLRVLANLKDEAAWLRVLGLYPGIGAMTAGKILEQIRRFETLSEALASEEISTGRGVAGWNICRGVLKHMLAAPQPSDMIRAVVSQGYKDYLEAEQPDFRDRLDDLEQFAVFAETVPDLHTFLDNVTLAENYGTTNTDQSERIVLSTIHQAKGLEWDAVFVIGLRDGAFPNPRALIEGAIEEERRLFYVAATRARDRLYLTYPLSGGRGEEFAFSQPSMFLIELPRSIMEEELRGVKRCKEGLNGWGDGEDEPTIVLDDLGERKKSSAFKATKSFLRSVDEL